MLVSGSWKQFWVGSDTKIHIYSNLKFKLHSRTASLFYNMSHGYRRKCMYPRGGWRKPLLPQISLETRLLLVSPHGMAGLFSRLGFHTCSGHWPLISYKKPRTIFTSFKWLGQGEEEDFVTHEKNFEMQIAEYITNILTEQMPRLLCIVYFLRQLSHDKGRYYTHHRASNAYYLAF